VSYSPFADDFLDMLTQTVTLAPFAGVTGKGQRSYGTARQYHCRVSADEKAIFTATGQTVFSAGKIMLHPKAVDGTVLTTITPDAKLTLPDGTSPRIVSIGSTSDETGVVYFEVRI
jgi:hypothetical protein